MKKISKEKIRKSEELFFDALEAETSHKCRQLLIRSINTNPENVDALVCLADLEPDPQDVVDMINNAILVAKKTLGEQYFINRKGFFWLDHEPRPFMRAMIGLAAFYVKQFEYAKAVEIYQEMLSLNPNDNQGVRYLLSTLYLELGKHDDFEEFYKQYDEDISAVMQFNRTLNAFILNGASKTTNELLVKAHQRNKHVIDYLTGELPIPYNQEDSEFITLGGEDEAIVYAEENKKLWQRTDKAIDWLLAFKSA